MNASSNDFAAESSSTEMLKSFTTAGPNGGSLESLPAMTAHALSAGFTRFHLLTYRQNGGRSLGRTRLNGLGRRGVHFDECAVEQAAGGAGDEDHQAGDVVRFAPS